MREYDDEELPWYDANVRMESQSARLHNEIVELTSLLQPTTEEDAQRYEAKTLLEDVVREIFPGSSLEVWCFGACCSCAVFVILNVQNVMNIYYIQKPVISEVTGFFCEKTT